MHPILLMHINTFRNGSASEPLLAVAIF